MRRALMGLAVGLVLAAAPPIAAQPSPDDTAESLRRELAETKAALESLQREHEQRLAALEARLAASPAAAAPTTAADAALEAELASSLAATPTTGRPAGPSAAGGVRARLVDVSLTGLFAAGTSTAENDVIQLLEGGGHDPHERGFTVQNVELSLAGAVDPYLKGEAHVVFQLDPEGATIVELEEAFLTTQSLPRGLQLKAGQYFTEFGRLNPQHPHQWQFADQPVVNTRMFGGDGMRGPGARLSWLTPAPWYSELLVGAQRAVGETMASFLAAEGEEFAGHPIGSKDFDTASDLLWSARWLNSVALSEATTLNLGLSAAFGPNATGPETDTVIAGLDAYLKWQPPSSEKGWPFVTVQAELMRRSYEAGEFVDDAGVTVPEEELDDWGAYTQVTWGFHPRWTIGWRFDYAEGDETVAGDARLDPLRDERKRLSSALTFYPTEFSKLRFQYNWDRAQFLGDGRDEDEHSFWLQFEFNVGAHGAHSF